MPHRAHIGLTILVLAAFVPGSAGAQSVDELIARNLEAKGGLERIKSVETLRMTGRTTAGPGVEAPFVMAIKRPNKMRTDIQVQGQTVTQAFDGKVGWQVTPGSTEPRSLPSTMTRALEEQADFFGPLVDAREKGLAVEYAGTVKLDSGEAHKLVLTTKGGDKRAVFLDAKTYLEVRGEMAMQVGGRTMQMFTVIGDYRPVDGLVLPHRMESGPVGAPRIRTTIEKIELNVPIDDARFAMPAKAEQK